MSTTEKWGYGFWLVMGLVFGIPESWAGLANPPWPSLSDTIAHLDALCLARYHLPPAASELGCPRPRPGPGGHTRQRVSPGG